MEIILLIHGSFFWVDWNSWFQPNWQNLQCPLFNTVIKLFLSTEEKTLSNTCIQYSSNSLTTSSVLFCSLAVLDLRVGHTMDVLSPFIPVLCHSDWLFHGESCPRPDVVHPGRAWPCSPSCTWHCSLHYLFLQATPLFPHGVTIVC